MSARFSRIGVVGAGAWGTALAIAAARAGREVWLLGRPGPAWSELLATRRSPRLPSFALPDAVRLASALDALAACEILLLATPAQALREALGGLSALGASPPLAITAKGIENATDLFLSEVAAQMAPGAPIAILSGPSFAADLAAGLPTAVTVAAAEAALASDIGDALQSANFRLYDSDDPRGAEIGGAAKNVLAIACGAAAGLRLGASANAALAARGFAELARFGAIYGAKPATLMGLSGLGDLVLTCASPQSRNYAYGFDLGRGLPPDQAGGGRLAEGAFTAAALVRLARAAQVDMPIAFAVDDVVAGRLTAAEAVGRLLSRPRKSEA